MITPISDLTSYHRYTITCKKPLIFTLGADKSKCISVLPVFLQSALTRCKFLQILKKKSVEEALSHLKSLPSANFELNRFKRLNLSS